MSHTCSSILMHCMDFRFGKAMKEFMAEKNLLGDADLVSFAGSAKNVVDPATREFALRQIEISKTLHGMKNVWLVNHTDCGAYGGRKAFADDMAEHDKHLADLREARKIVQEKWPDLTIWLTLAHIDETEHEPKIWFEEVG